MRFLLLASWCVLVALMVVAFVLEIGAYLLRLPLGWYLTLG